MFFKDDDFNCPIYCTEMDNPIIGPDNTTYQRAAIAEHIRLAPNNGQWKSPCTGKMFAKEASSLRENTILKRLILLKNKKSFDDSALANHVELTNLFYKQLDDLFLCPISGLPFKDPVVAADGLSYEREHIRALMIPAADWKSPVTNERHSNKTLYSNFALKFLVERRTKLVNSQAPAAQVEPQNPAATTLVTADSIRTDFGILQRRFINKLQSKKLHTAWSIRCGNLAPEACLMFEQHMLDNGFKKIISDLESCIYTLDDATTPATYRCTEIAKIMQTRKERLDEDWTKLKTIVIEQMLDHPNRSAWSVVRTECSRLSHEMMITTLTRLGLSARLQNHNTAINHLEWRKNPELQQGDTRQWISAIVEALIATLPVATALALQRAAAQQQVVMDTEIRDREKISNAESSALRQQAAGMQKAAAHIQRAALRQQQVVMDTESRDREKIRNAESSALRQQATSMQKATARIQQAALRQQLAAASPAIAPIRFFALPTHLFQIPNELRMHQGINSYYKHSGK